MHINKLIQHQLALTYVLIKGRKMMGSQQTQNMTYNLGFSRVPRHGVEECNPQLFDTMGSSRFYFLPLTFQSLVKMKLKG